MNGAQMVRALEKLGYYVARVCGSHHVLRHPDGRTVIVPVHQGRDLPKGTLRNILAHVGLTVDELVKLL